MEREDPAREIEGVSRALVDYPTLQKQKETLDTSGHGQPMGCGPCR